MKFTIPRIAALLAAAALLALPLAACHSQQENTQADSPAPRATPVVDNSLTPETSQIDPFFPMEKLGTAEVSPPDDLFPMEVKVPVAEIVDPEEGSDFPMEFVDAPGGLITSSPQPSPGNELLPYGAPPDEARPDETRLLKASPYEEPAPAAEPAAIEPVISEPAFIPIPELAPALEE
ncbi:MAG: hypothetical protein LBE49_06525 [Deltaproteobacteria bacterium]|jgi:hypothetical protein|nr:hypothetical protein [Deltaproteobacteria bacterium]